MTTTATTILSKEDQEALMRWPYIYKIPIFPADTVNKSVSLKQWNTTDFSTVDFRAEILSGKYDNGAAARLGPTSEEGVYSVALDFDGWDAVVAWFGSWDNVVAHSKKSLVEWHQDKGKIHVILFTHEPLPNKKIHIGEKNVLLEIRCEKQSLFISPSPHKDGNKYTPLGISHIETLDSRSGLLQLTAKIHLLCDAYMSNDDKDEYDAWLDLDTTILGEGAGRHDATKFKICSFFWRYTGEWLNLTDDERFSRAWRWHLNHCKPPRTRDEFDRMCEWVKQNHRAKRDGEHQRIRDEINTAKQQQAAAQNYKPHNGNKQAELECIHNEQLRKILDADVWTRISESPPKFIVARQRACHICRASITYTDSSGAQLKTEHLNYGSILIRLYPKQVTLHESPLKFLEASPQYTIVFENQDKHEVIVSGTIDGIISRLKEMPGYVVSSYGIVEALTAIIGAFKDDMKLQIDKTVEFEGYYYNDKDVQISRIDLDEKHPRRTKQEVIDCINYLEKRSGFQVWKDKQGHEIDRRDLLASLIQWTIPGPFNFLLKQLNCKPYLKGFDMTGERDGGKTGLSEEMLNMHGSPTNEQDADSIYSVSAGSANTEAKFGKAVSRTTYPIEISEFGKVESYGRHEDLVECYKTAVDVLIVRRGKKDSRTDAPFPSLSPLIINGNPPFSFKGELLKRYHVAKFSEEDRHDRSPNSPFNAFQRENKHHWRTLGDWTVRYILDNKQELLLSRKYGPYEVGKKALEAFYKYGDSEIPEWLTWWITDTSLEELDQDFEGIIRSILYNHIHKTLRENPYFIDLETNGANVYMPERLNKCIESGVWSWIRKVERAGNDSKYYIYGSIMELFSQRLPDLTFKKLAEKMGLQYVSAEGKRRILCTKVQLDNFLVNGEA